MKRIVVAMSGGVDSSVAAALLKEQGFEVSGMFMKNWSPDDLQSMTDCPWEQDQADAAAVCAHLGIPFRSINFEREYKEKVVDYFLGEYAAGRTPNPDVMCNKEIKFSAFLKAAEEMGAEAIATGHYAQVKDGHLYRGADPKKDQSYFLYTLQSHQLTKSLFPLGGYSKQYVRELAEAYGLPTAKKKDSQGICFIGQIDLKEFLFNHIAAKPGSTYLLQPGKTLEDRMRNAWLIGKHEGSMFYTLGERMGHCVDNRLFRQFTGRTDVPVTYLVASDVERNRLYISDDHDDKDLFTSTLYLDGCVLTGSSSAKGKDSMDDTLEYRPGLSCQIRYQQNPVLLKSVHHEDGKTIIESQEPLWAAAPGQSLVIYEGQKVVGGGVICATLR